MQTYKITFNMSSLMITMTDVFYSIGDIFKLIFKGMRVLGHGPNIILWSIIAFLLVYQVMQILKQNKEADKNGTLR